MATIYRDRDAHHAKEIPLTSEIEKALKTNKKAWENFNNLAPQLQKAVCRLVKKRKKQETVERRIEEAIKLLTEKKKLGMK